MDTFTDPTPRVKRCTCYAIRRWQRYATETTPCRFKGALQENDEACFATLKHPPPPKVLVSVSTTGLRFTESQEKAEVVQANPRLAEEKRMAKEEKKRCRNETQPAVYTHRIVCQGKRRLWYGQFTRNLWALVQEECWSASRGAGSGCFTL